MAENSNSSGSGNAGLAFIVGGIVVVLAIVAWFVFAGGGAMTPDTRDVSVDVNLPQMEAPRMPQVEPPTLPQPGPSPSN